ncbi:hypothetical protein P152DRAFT_51668 [Eremomyces bilateralis CBS 781.70]|uniref:Zinc-ribbon domain-containing protein n=1 Tax=Eremomyces bilateralis CBS 781.70 TaxID=1392243 RepID=A0A6G1G1I8_9PEZI|nr:uncharacterized protein P152DRAFT_51668 [Eremomyces bilateralis CBS 781.70]KAF1811796.1 hypothetical protein P152DRAFT_51668 [Eremomyces bilateralis CBS 781.70]
MIPVCSRGAWRHPTPPFPVVAKSVGREASYGIQIRPLISLDLTPSDLILFTNLPSFQPRPCYFTVHPNQSGNQSRYPYLKISSPKSTMAHESHCPKCGAQFEGESKSCNACGSVSDPTPWDQLETDLP